MLIPQPFESPMTHPDLNPDPADALLDLELQALSPPPPSAISRWGGVTLGIIALLGWGSVVLLQSHWPTLTRPQFSSHVNIPPLVMEGGDPYLRALMRTISASESNTPQPYHVIYGGQHVKDLSKHPDLCITIKAGPNRGNCSTASGRYQFLNTTWAEKARQYHPHPHKFLLWKNYSFEPQYQDQVLYRWLADSHAWGTDLSKLLRQGGIKPVLKKLSPTWTSLGYGIETNWMSPRLPQVYEQLLEEELQRVSTAKIKTSNP